MCADRTGHGTSTLRSSAGVAFQPFEAGAVVVIVRCRARWAADVAAARRKTRMMYVLKIGGYTSR